MGVPTHTKLWRCVHGSDNRNNHNDNIIIATINGNVVMTVPAAAARSSAPPDPSRLDRPAVIGFVSGRSDGKRGRAPYGPTTVAAPFPRGENRFVFEGVFSQAKSFFKPNRGRFFFCSQEYEKPERNTSVRRSKRLRSRAGGNRISTPVFGIYTLPRYPRCFRWSTTIYCTPV